jgi:hypothetical protein
VAFIDAHDAVEVQFFLRRHTFEEREDLLELFFSRFMELTSESPPDEQILTSFPKVFGLAFDESMFRALSKPILQTIHDGPLSGEDRCFKMGPLIPMLAHSISLICRFVLFCRQQSEEKAVGCWQIETNFEKMTPRRSLQHDVDEKRLAANGYSMHLWIKPSVSDSPMSLLTLLRRETSAKDAQGEMLIDMNLKENLLSISFSKPAEKFNFEIAVEKAFLLSLSISPTGIIQVLLDGNLKLEKKVSLLGTIQRESVLNAQPLSYYNGFLYGYLTLYEASQEKIMRLATLKHHGVQTNQHYDELNKIFTNTNLDQILNPVFQGACC